MKKLIECVDMTYANGIFLLQPKQSCEMDLVMLGFNGTEKWIRLQCVREDHPGLGYGEYYYTATICKHDNSSWSWHWGWGGHTLISESVREMQKKIVEACGIYSKDNGIPFPGKGW